MENKIVMQYGNLRIAAEIYHDGGHIPADVCVYLCDENGNPTQDICVVRPALYYRKGEWVTDENFVDCLVWGDSESEDYTRKHTIGVYKEEKQIGNYGFDVVQHIEVTEESIVNIFNAAKTYCIKTWCRRIEYDDDCEDLSATEKLIKGTSIWFYKSLDIAHELTLQKFLDGMQRCACNVEWAMKFIESAKCNTIDWDDESNAYKADLILQYALFGWIMFDGNGRPI